MPRTSGREAEAGPQGRRVDRHQVGKQARPEPASGRFFCALPNHTVNQRAVSGPLRRSDSALGSARESSSATVVNRDARRRFPSDCVMPRSVDSAGRREGREPQGGAARRRPNTLLWRGRYLVTMTGRHLVTVERPRGFVARGVLTIVNVRLPHVLLAGFRGRTGQLPSVLR